MWNFEPIHFTCETGISYVKMLLFHKFVTCGMIYGIFVKDNLVIHWPELINSNYPKWTNVGRMSLISSKYSRFSSETFRKMSDKHDNSTWRTIKAYPYLQFFLSLKIFYLHHYIFACSRLNAKSMGVLQIFSLDWFNKRIHSKSFVYPAMSWDVVVV